MRQPISAVIITLNEADKIHACLQSVQFCDEILVVDCGSTDRTVALCEQHGARVVQQTWLGFGAQKRFAVEQAAHDWVLCLDADEYLSAELQENIQRALETPTSGAYKLTRCNRFMGRWLRHGEGYPDYCLRLFDRREAQWSLDRVHEKVVTTAAISFVRGDLLHESETTLEQYLVKQNRYTSLQAEELIERGKRVTLVKLAFSPLVRFFKFYVVRQGFRDGLPGLVHIAIGCFNSFTKYAKVWSHNHKSAAPAALPLPSHSAN